MIELIKDQTVSIDNHDRGNDSDSFETIHIDDDMYFLLLFMVRRLGLVILKIR